MGNHLPQIEILTKHKQIFEIFETTNNSRGFMANLLFFFRLKVPLDPPIINKRQKGHTFSSWIRPWNISRSGQPRELPGIPQWER